MIRYDDVPDILSTLPPHLMKVISPWDDRQGETGCILDYPAMLELYHFTIRNIRFDESSVRPVVDLITRLYEDGDERCKNLVGLQFFDLLADEPNEIQSLVCQLFSDSMRTVIAAEMSNSI